MKLLLKTPPPSRSRTQTPPPSPLPALRRGGTVKRFRCVDLLMVWIVAMGLLIFIRHSRADNLGMWEIDDALIFNATVHDATGIAQAADTNVYWRVYENETGTALLNGSMTRIDSTNFPGTYTESVTLSAANGFEVGKQYTVAMKAGVDGVTGEHTHNFQVHQYSDYKATVTDYLTETAADALVARATGDVITEVNANETKIDTLDTVADGIQTDLSNGTDGLGALKLLIDAVDLVVDAIKVKTDPLNFTGTDVKATLDGEAVAVDAGAVWDATVSINGATTGEMLRRLHSFGAGKVLKSGDVYSYYDADAATLIYSATHESATRTVTAP
jgi:hypothetical protein